MPTLTKSEVRKYAQKVIMMAGVIAGFTPTQKDDAFVALLDSVVNDPDQFDQLCEIMGITD